MPSGLDGNRNPITSPARSRVIGDVVRAVTSRRRPGVPMLVGIDGIDGSGKSTFADELAKALAATGLRVVRSSVDSFHRPRAERWRRGKDSPVGFYLDSHDLEALGAKLLDPFRAGPGSTYVPEVFDEPTDTPVVGDARIVGADDVLVFDGIFVLRPELVDYWDVSVFLDGADRVALERLGLVAEELPVERDRALRHVLEWAARIDRYAAGMRYYLDLVDPLACADIVIDNNDLAAPRVTRRGVRAP